MSEVKPGQETALSVQQITEATKPGGGAPVFRNALNNAPFDTTMYGPNLVDNQFVHPRVSTDVGTFEIIYAGGAGAMQAFGNRLTQEEILKIMAFLDSIKKR